MNYYTCEVVNQLPEEVLEVCYAYTASSKNIYNSTLYLIKQLASSYDKIINKEKNDSLASYVLKDNLHSNHIEILELAHQTIEAINSKRLKNIDKLKSHLDFNQPIKDTLIKLKKEYDNLSPNYEPEIDSTVYYKFLDINFINNLLKLKEKDSKFKDYTEVPSHIANAAVKRAVDDYKNYLASLKAYFKNKANFLGLPKLPGYKSKNSRLTYELDKNRLTKEGYLARVITQHNIKTFGSIKDKSNFNKLFTCAQKKDLINPKVIEKYNQFSFNDVIKNTVTKVQQRDNKHLAEYEKYQNKKLKIESKVEFVSFKFIPNDKYSVNGQPKVIVQAVLKHAVDLPDGNLLNQILKVNAKFLELPDLNKVKFIQDHFSKNINNNKDNELNKSKTKHNNNKIIEKYKIASTDLGVVNHLTIAFNTGSKPIIISGKKYNNYVRNNNLKLDILKSSLIPESIKTIQSNYSKLKNNYEKLNSKTEEWETRIVKDKILTCLKESKRQELIKKEDYPRLSRSDKELINQSTQAVYNHPDYAKQLTALNNYKKNYLYKLSSSIIDLCNFNSIQYLVIGKNDLWKQATSIGKNNNKDFHSIAHTELINYIKYKALLFGIVVLVTEESYTSKTSFVNGAKLLKFDGYKSVINNTLKVSKIEKIDNQTNENKILTKGKKLNQTKIKLSAKANPESKKLTTFGGYRRSRGVYVNESKQINKGKSPKNLLIHADVNASYNIMCKVFKQIKYNPLQHELSYKIMAVQSNKKRLQLLL